MSCELPLYIPLLSLLPIQNLSCFVQVSNTAMVLLRIFVGHGDVNDAATPVSSTNLCLSAANEAMLALIHDSCIAD